MIQQTLAEIDEGGGMKHLIAQVAVEGKVPTRMIAEPFHSLTVGNCLQILQEAHPQEQDRLAGHPPIVGAVTGLQLGTTAHQHRINLLGKKPVPVRRPKEAAGQSGRGKEFGLGGKYGQAHKLGHNIGLLYKVAIKIMQAEFEMKVQVIRSKGRATRLFVNIPLPLAAALDFQAGERVRWQLLTRSELRLVRLEAPRLKKRSKKA